MSKEKSRGNREAKKPKAKPKKADPNAQSKILQARPEQAKGSGK